MNVSKVIHEAILKRNSIPLHESSMYTQLKTTIHEIIGLQTLLECTQLKTTRNMKSCACSLEYFVMLLLIIVCVCIRVFARVYTCLLA